MSGSQFDHAQRKLDEATDQTRLTAQARWSAFSLRCTSPVEEVGLRSNASSPEVSTNPSDGVASWIACHIAVLRGLYVSRGHIQERAFHGNLQLQHSRSMRHVMPIVTPRLVLRPPTLDNLDSIQAAKEDAWPRLAALDGLGVRQPTIAASNGRLDSKSDGLPASNGNRVGRIP